MSDALSFDDLIPAQPGGTPRLSFGVDRDTGTITPSDGAGDQPPGPLSFDDLIPAPQNPVTRQAGLTARYLGEGLPMLPNMVGDAANTAINLGARGINALVGSHLPMLPMPSQVTSKTLDDMGIPTPANPWERIAGSMSESLASLPASIATAAASGVKALAPLAQDFGRQASSALGASFGQQGAKELGLPLWAQIASGLGFGTIAGIRPGPSDPDMQDRLKAFTDSNIDPNAADVTQSKSLQAVRKATEETPFAGVPEREIQRLAQAQAQARSLAESVGTPSTPQSLGDDIQSGIEGYRFGKPPAGMTQGEIIAAPTKATSVSAKANAIYDRIPIAPEAPVSMDNTTQALSDITGKYTNDALNKLFSDPTAAKIKAAIEGGDGTLNWQDVRNLRSDVRLIQSKAALDPTINDRDLNNLYGALTQDMHAGAEQIGGPRALQMVQRADSYYAGSMQRLTDNLKSIFGAKRAEGVYSQIKSAMSPNAAKGDIAKLTELKRALPGDIWHDLSATVIDDLGKPTPGQIGAPGQPNFSVGKFVTDYANISPQAKGLMFNGVGNGELRRSLDALSDAAASMKATDKLANVSQSGNRAALVGLGAGMLAAPKTTMGLLAAANITARAMYNPAFVRLMTRTVSATNPAAMEQTALQVVRFANQNPAYGADASELLRALVPVRADSSDKTK